MQTDQSRWDSLGSIYAPRDMEGNKLAKLGALLALLLFVLAPSARAQFSSSLAGTVEDRSGAVVVNATATLTNHDTNQKLVSVTSATGDFHFNELPPGHYSLTVTATGFKQSDFADITLEAEVPRNLNVALDAGGSNEVVTVTANETPLLQTGDASIQTTLDSTAIENLPAYGSDPFELLRTAPGITGDGSRSGNGNANFLPNGAGPGGSNSGIFQTENQVQITADGQRQADNNYMIDGVSVNSLTHGGSAVVTPNIEAVGQITVISTSYDASDGRNSGAQVKVVTKAGSNQLHGSGYFQYDEPGLNAYNRWGGPQGALPFRVDNKSRTYAGSLGGPIKKDRIFLFASYEGYTTASNNSETAYVETQQYRADVIANRPGGVSAAILATPGVVPRISNVITPSCAGFGTGNCAVVAGGLDIGSLTPGGASQLGVFPANTAVGGGLDGIPDVENVQLSVPSHSRGNQFNGRGDWYITSKDQVTGSFYLTKLDNYGTSGTTGSRPQADLPFKPQNSAGTGIYIHTFSPTWLNELRGNGTRFADNELQDDSTSAVDYGIPFINVQTLPFPIQYGVQSSTTTPSAFAENTFEVRDMLTHTWGAHTIRIGAEARYEQDNDNLFGFERPTYAMQGLWTLANDASVFEQVSANPNTGGTAETQRYFRSQDYALYVQHDWKATPTLTLNAGLRWELFTPLANKGSRINYPILGPSGTELSGMHMFGRNHLWNSQSANLAPKFGFAWNPTQLNSKLVIRGGFAMAYNHLDIALFNNALEDGPNIALFNLCCGGNSNKAGIVYALGTSNSPTSFPLNPALKTGINSAGFPNGVGQVEVYGALPNLKYPMSYLFSLESQYQLPYQMTLTVGYAGSVGHHYARLVNQNFLYNNTNSPVFASYFAQTDSNQAYDALNVQFTRNFTHSLSFNANYTYSKSMDQVSNGDGADSNANQTDPANNATEWGPSDYDVRHRITISGLYEVPHIHSGNGAVQAAANGWRINGILTYHTAFPWTPVTYDLATTSVDNSAQVGPTRPLAYLGGAGTSCSTDAFKNGTNFPNGGPAYFDTTVPTLGPGQTYFYVPGIGRNSFRGPCYFNTDISLSKEIATETLGHHFVLKFQANLFNVFNKLQLQPITNGNANPGANIQGATFGFAQNGDAGRQIEFLTRIQF